MWLFWLTYCRFLWNVDYFWVSLNFFDKILPFQHRLSAAILWLIIFFGIPKIFQKSCQKKFYKSNFFRGLHAFNRGKKYDKNEKNKMFHTIFIFVDRNREIFYTEGSREREKLAFPEKVVAFLLRITNDFCLVVPPIDLTMTLWKFSPFLHCNPLKSQRKKTKQLTISILTKCMIIGRSSECWACCSLLYIPLCFWCFVRFVPRA